MKKIFSILVFTVVLCPFGFAQSTPLPGIEVIIKAIENRITDPDFVEPAFFTERVIDGEYQTVEENRLRMTPEEYREFYAKEPILNAPETKTTNQYKKATIRKKLLIVSKQLIFSRLFGKILYERIVKWKK